eukprot:1617446-Rhodomonas_salina.1
MTRPGGLGPGSLPVAADDWIQVGPCSSARTVSGPGLPSLRLRVTAGVTESPAPELEAPAAKSDDPLRHPGHCVTALG